MVSQKTNKIGKMEKIEKIGKISFLCGKKITVVDTILFIIITVLNFVMIYPLVNITAVSVSSQMAYVENPMMIFPKGITTVAYQLILQSSVIKYAYLNTIIITVVGTFLSLFLYVTAAYPLSKKDFRGRSVIMKIIIFTMLFSGGLIPSFLLIKSLKLYDTLTALIMPSLFSAFNLVLVKNYFETIPQSLIESAKLDGVNEFMMLWKIIVPLSKAIISTIGLFVAVEYWNSYFSAVVYTSSVEKWTLQLLLRELIMSANLGEVTSLGDMAEISRTIPTESVKYAALVITILPILCIYPFVQKYFVSGIMIGAVKG